MLAKILKRALRRLTGSGGDAARSVGEAGRLAAQTGDLPRARELLEHATRLDPGSADALADLGNVLGMLGEPDAAVRSFAAALGIDSRHVAAHNNLGLLLGSIGDRTGALTHFRAAMDIDPQFAPAIRNLVGWLPDSEVPTEDISMLGQIVARYPDHGEAHAALGALHLRGAFDATPALAALDRAIALGIDDADVHARRGVALQELGCTEEALAALDCALARNPNHASARFHRALALLALGRFAEGWPGYETRLVSEDLPHRALPAPRWAGEPLEGRTILVHAEQGVGDEILFASCIPDVIARAGHCVIECDPRLASLYRRSFPQATIIAGRQQEPLTPSGELRIDYQIPVASLPVHLRRASADFPARAGYLRADPAQIAEWRERLAASGAGRRVGISWRGGTVRSRGPVRSLEASALASLLRMPAVHWVSLQRDADVAELAALGEQYGTRIDAWPEALEDLDATAALVSAVDLTISIDNTVAQLAGGLGVHGWVLVPVGAEWRYGTTGNAIIWYPGVRVFRQRRRGEWNAVLDDLCRELRTETEARY
ncbi:MAG: tetratricopeptide repeat protein [Burkholderiales bacterium]